jgi:DNA ligase D-like protein (predicted ligase)
MSKKVPKVAFIEPMLLLRTEKLPEGPEWLVELKLDGYRALAIKSGGKVQLRSRNNNDFSSRYPRMIKALSSMPDETVIDGEVVALDEDGRPSFNSLQNYGRAGIPLHFFIFDLLMLHGREVMAEPLVKRRELIEKHVLPTLADPIRYSPILEASLPDLICSVKAQGLEGLVAKRRNSSYEPGVRSGAWQKMRVNRGQEFAIAGYTPSLKNFDALVIGYYEGDRLIYAARTRSGFSPTSRAELFKKIEPLQIKRCPFANLPEKKAGRWGEGLTAAKMVECRWVEPRLVGQFEFVEWTAPLNLDKGSTRVSERHALSTLELSPANLWDCATIRKRRSWGENRGIVKVEWPHDEKPTNHSQSVESYLLTAGGRPFVARASFGCHQRSTTPD